MKPSRSNSQQRENEKTMVWLVMPISSAGTGALFGGVIGLIAGDMLQDIVGFQFFWWQKKQWEKATTKSGGDQKTR